MSGKWTKWTQKREKTFLDLLRETCNVTSACQAIGASRSGAYKRRDENADFAERWDNAIEEALDSIEAEVIRRGVHGIDDPVFYRGEQVSAVKRYSDNLLMFYLKGRRPEVFKDRSENTHHHDGFQEMLDRIKNSPLGSPQERLRNPNLKLVKK